MGASVPPDKSAIAALINALHHVNAAKDATSVAGPKSGAELTAAHEAAESAASNVGKVRAHEIEDAGDAPFGPTRFFSNLARIDSTLAADHLAKTKKAPTGFTP